MERAKTTKIVLVHGVGHKQGSGDVRPIWFHVLDRAGQELCPTRSKIDIILRIRFRRDCQNNGRTYCLLITPKIAYHTYW